MRQNVQQNNINIQQVLTTYGVPFITSGKNVGKDSINIQCPFCKGEDKSRHMGLSLVGKGYSCWRNPKHRGRNLAWVFKALGITVSGLESYDDPSGFEKLVSGDFFTKPEVKTPSVRISVLPDYFVPIKDSVEDNLYKNYLKSRGFDEPDRVIEEFDLRKSHHPRWDNRIIIPVKLNDTITWTSRSILNTKVLDHIPRYLSASPKVAFNIKDTIFNYNRLASSSGMALVITEGPFDSMKLMYSSYYHIMSTCLFGLSASDNQIQLLKSICLRYDKVFLALDDNVIGPAISFILEKLSLYKIQMLQLPEKDFGDMSPVSIRSYIQQTVLQ